MAILQSKRKCEDARMIKRYWEGSREIGGGVLHDILQDRKVEDIVVMTCLQGAVDDWDFEAIHICGYLLCMSEDDRERHLLDVLGWPTALSHISSSS